MTIVSAVVHAVAAAAAFLVSLRRQLVVHHFTVDDCVAEDREPGTTELSIYCIPLETSSRWRLGAWIDTGLPTDAEGSLQLRLLGWSAEVWYVKKGMEQTSSRPQKLEPWDAEYLVETGWVPTGWKRAAG